MRPLLFTSIAMMTALAACGGDPPETPEPTAFPLEVRFINESDEELVVAGIKIQLLVPGAEDTEEISRNWSRPAPGAELEMADLDEVPIETEIQVWYSVLAYWNPEETAPRWRAWTTDVGIVRKASDAALTMNWPDGRWDLTEVPWLTSDESPQDISKP